MAERLLTPSKITAWLDCPHHLTLSRRVDAGEMPRPEYSFGSFARLLADKGLRHEADCLAHYEAEGRSVFQVPDRTTGESFAAWVERVGNPLADGHDVVFQMPLVHDGVRGVADFLVRVEDDETGMVTYEPVDAKLARTEGKPGHILQLCFYADAVEALTGARPEWLHLWLGSGRIEPVRLADVDAYWRRLRSQLASLVDDADPTDDTRPEPCDHCEFCEFEPVCIDQWRGEDALHYVAGIRRQDRATLVEAGVDTLAALATHDTPIDGLADQRLARLRSQAELQVTARVSVDGPPPFSLIEPGDDPVWGRGFAQLPEPDEGDVFLDFEGHPFWRADAGLFFLFGALLRDEADTWVFKEWWAHDLDAEAEATRSLVEFLANRRRDHPNMHVYHYNHTERSALERLAEDHGVAEASLAELVETGCFVDLLLVARNSLQAGVESYGLKYLERLTDYERGHDIDQGAGAVVEYEQWTIDGDQGWLDRIAAYNEDDVRATRAFRDWLVDHRPPDLEWRAAWLEPDEGIPELDAQVEALHAFGPDTPEHLLGHVLGYWRREWLANLAPKLVASQADPSTVMDAPDVLAGLEPVGLVDRFGKKGQPLKVPAMRFRLPSQATDDFCTSSTPDNVVFCLPDGPVGYASVARLDIDTGEVDLLWNERNQEIGTTPTTVVLNDWVSPNPKPQALSELAARVLDPSSGATDEVAMRLLRRDPPRFTPGNGPPDGTFGDDIDEMRAWAPHLDHSYVAIQGPPGSGKTFCGAHLVHSLIAAGQRVGITAMSHSAIDNLLEAVVDRFADEGNPDDLRAARRGTEPAAGGLPGVTYVGSNPPAARDTYNLVAGTTWLFANEVMRDSPVDVLIVDEAGQLALADALAASGAARNMVLLGDPLQLPQVAQATHPGGGGASVLEHILGDEETMPSDRGVFLSTTRRMHPDVCRFISERIYQGRLGTHESCELQATEFGTGLRWLPAHHAERATESEEEAELVAEQISRLVGTRWTNQEGKEAPLGVEDFMVVAPFNDQVKLMRRRLDVDERTRGVPVGTVDKFQGRQAAVVFFTMTTSSAADMTRGAEFLFSRNRLNVAVSRARCLAYLVCTKDLLNSRARTVEEMRLIATLCSFVEHCDGSVR